MTTSLRFLAVICIGLLLALPSRQFAKFTETAIITDDSIQRLTILFSGDVMQHQTQLDAAYNPLTGKYEYDSCFAFISPFISAFDVAVANLEVTLAGAPYRGYPQFSAPDELAIALRNAGFDYVVTANNHSCDRGKKGIERTIKILDSLGLRHTGTFMDSAERAQHYPLIVDKNGIRVALLNYTYGTNGLAIPHPTIVNMIDTAVIAADLTKAKDSLPDKIIIFVHWGDEYQSKPNTYQKAMADFFFRKGADIVIGSHPHVVQKMERFHYPDSSGREVMITYSLGNYISNQRDRGRDGGASFAMELIRENGDVRIGFAGYYLSWVWVRQTAAGKDFFILPVQDFENDTVLPDAASRAKLGTFEGDARALFSTENTAVPEYKYDGNKR